MQNGAEAINYLKRLSEVKRDLLREGINKSSQSIVASKELRYNKNGKAVTGGNSTGVYKH